MPTSLTDQMFQVEQKSLTDQMFEPTDGQGSLTDQMFGPSVDAPVVEPEIKPKLSMTPEQFYNSTAASPFGFMSPEIASYMDRQGMGIKPEGGFDEFGRAVDADAKPYYTPKESSVAADGFMSTLKGYGSLATQPMEVVRGAADFFLSIPGFLVGLGSAANNIVKGSLDQLILGQYVDLNELYEKASEGMHKGMEFFEPAKELLVGEPTEESQLVAQTAMAPLTGLSMIGQEVAAWPGFKDYPNIQGAAKFTGDITGMLALGMIYGKGSSRTKVTADIEGVTKDAVKIKQREQQVSEIPDEVVRKAYEKIVETEKNQLELRAAEITKNIDKDTLIKEELYRKAEEVAQRKVFPVKATGLKKPSEAKVKKLFEEKEEVPGVEVGEKIVTDPKEVKKAVEEIGEPITNDVAKAAKSEFNATFWDNLENKNIWRVGEKEYATDATKSSSEQFTELRNKIEKGIEEPKVKQEKITDLDQTTGTSIPSLEGENSPFFQNTETTKIFEKLYEERETAVTEDVELFTQKLINDVNRWYHGEKDVDIAKVRETLSTLAARGEELIGDFVNRGDHLAWKETVSEAATWARRIDNKIIKRSGKDPGTKLYSGFPIDEAAKLIIAGAKKVSEYTKRARGMKEFKPVQAAKMLKEEFNRAFIDRSGNIRNDLLDKLGEEGYKIVQSMVLSKGASSISANMLKQMQKEVYSGLNKRERQILDTLIFSDRMVDISKYKSEGKFKFPEGVEPKNAVAYSELFEFIEKLTPERGVDIRNRAKGYFEWMKKPLQDMVDAGLISQEEFTALSSHNYRKLKLIDVYDRKQPKTGKKGRTIYDSGVEALARGRDTDIFEPSSEIMALEVFNRTYGRILNNEANKRLLEVARTNKENPFVRVKESKSDMIPSGWHRSFVYEGGERKTIYLSPEMSKEWITSNPETSYKFSQLMRYSSGSPVLRSFATGINWGFALANLPRDVMHTWFTARTFKDGEWSSVYSPSAPKFGPQITADLARVFTDAATKGKKYNDYINEGGGMEFLVHQGRLFQRGKHIEGPIDSVYNFLGYFGETSEVMTRLAIRDRVIRNRAKERGITYEQAYKNKDITREATFAARDYMDFGQGGGIAKALDNAIPYLNASIQGSRGMFRAFKPGSGTAFSSTYKLAQFGAIVSGIYIAANKMHPESSKALKGDINTQNNLVLPIGDDFGFEDERGQIRYPYIKIPLDPGQRFFKAFFEGSTDKWLGNEVDVDQLTDTLKQFSPVSEVSGVLPPTVSGALGYVTNKDFWLNEEIWRKTDKPFSYPQSQEEFISGQTPQGYIDFGKITGMSPERTKYIVEELTTNGTLWSYLLGQGYDQLRGLPKDQREQHLAMVLAKTPVIKRFFGVTNPYSKFAGKIESADEASDIERWVQKRELDRLTEGYLFENSVTRKEIFKNINSYKDKDTRDRLRDRFEFQEKTKTLPNRSFWLRLKGLTTDARADVFVDRLKKSNAEEKSQLWKEYGEVSRIGGITSEGFRNEVRKKMMEKDN